ncbi:MAG: aldehyde dehydrogenase family protein [Myxococcota bacterium]|nr:aldehyde dehydrogenase family protein [Myxococcota bacterium]
MTLPRQRASAIIEKQKMRPPLHLIDGNLVESSGNETIRIINPADNTSIGRIASGSATDIDAAIQSSREIFRSRWSSVTGSKREELLHNLANALEKDADNLAILESLQTGKTYREVLVQDLAFGVQVLRYYAGLVTKAKRTSHSMNRVMSGHVNTEPYEVVGALLSWKAPLLTAISRVAEAIAAGTTIILKPSELAPLTTLRLGELALEAGIPRGVINVVTGHGSKTGQALALHPQLGAIHFSGSIENGRHILVASAKSNLKPVSLSMGGKSANIIFEDADLRSACTAAWKAIFSHRGGRSIAGSRLLVHDSIYDQVVQVITQRAREISLGDPLDEHTEMGPVISEEHLKRVLGYISLGRKENARLVAGGGRDVVGLRAQGYFVQPTVFMNVKPEMRIAQEEIPGPVLAIIRFKDDDDALQIANDTEYGMASAIWTQDINRIQRFTRDLRCGTVWTNCYGVLDPAIPFGGIGLSGYSREFGENSLSQFCYEKSVFVQSK